jgi:hypothetical protein
MDHVGGCDNNNKCNGVTKAKKREKRKETLQIHRHAPVHVSECTHAKDATEDYHFTRVWPYSAVEPIPVHHVMVCVWGGMGSVCVGAAHSAEVSCVELNCRAIETWCRSASCCVSVMTVPHTGGLCSVLRELPTLDFVRLASEGLARPCCGDSLSAISSLSCTFRIEDDHHDIVHVEHMYRARLTSFVIRRLSCRAVIRNIVVKVSFVRL